MPSRGSNDTTQQHLAGGEAAAVLRCQCEAPIERAGGEPSDMRHQHDIGQLEQGLGRVMRFMDEHVEAGTGQPAATSASVSAA